jgi:hypothetical protein
VAKGFSQNTYLPAAIEDKTNSSCVGPIEQTNTAFISGLLISSWGSSKTFTDPNSLESLLAFSLFMSLIAFTIPPF